ncbi:hypothetical protein LPK76_26135, partial [Klebsiella pneumoniae]|nr:hypothetical protein [Klebsiella pneumoniae]
WKPPAHSPEENMVRQKCSGIRRSYLDLFTVAVWFFMVIMMDFVKKKQLFTPLVSLVLER